jgi:5-methylcytosine-specific restriction endonuclease McrA
MTSYHTYIEEACSALSKGALDEARDVIKNKYPFEGIINLGRRYTNQQKSRVFLRDGFIDRYSGERMVFPPVLRIMSLLMPEEFPFHKNRKTSECHLAYWHLLPTIDHVVPISRGGKDDESNWVCASQLRNSAKSNWLLEELGWELQAPGSLEEWDGLLSWFIQYTEGHPEVLADQYVLSWHKAAMYVLRHGEGAQAHAAGREAGFTG